MLIINDPDQLREKIKQLKSQGQEVAFVPTMGNLHDGHLTLVRQGKKKAPVLVVSIFVNPMQFNNAADLDNYPKTLEADCKALEQEGVDIVFTPSADVIYPNGLAAQTYVEVPGLSDCLEGELRPGHFRGMSTIVNKLFNLVQPDYACFGEKDFQQLAIVKQMVTDLAMPIKIIPVATVRESSGLAMSSRNNKLSTCEKEQAPLLAQVMNKLALDVQNQQAEHGLLIHDASKQLDNNGFNTDAIHIVDSSTLQAVSSETRQAVILMAAFLGSTRLIDNKVVNLVS
ncbi:pantoate--beta-alanine ligase [Psychromonas aquimarina]|uniref:pantoate--beta-alanine ligase n=1 Tax=Psychromonas aquimarina TaxID=444919 RepID=UPI0003F5021D|nr:pantoate--beta-alanine ligase [Psychromonas aquimarina]